jgi:hypothetical protein
MRYYINRIKHDGVYNEIHVANCSYLPTTANRVDLGVHPNYLSAKMKAKSLGYNPDGCGHCCKGTHHG